MSLSNRQTIESVKEKAAAAGLDYAASAWLLFRQGNGQGVAHVKDFPAVDAAVVKEGEGKFWQECAHIPGRLFLFSPARALRALETHPVVSVPQLGRRLGKSNLSHAVFLQMVANARMERER